MFLAMLMNMVFVFPASVLAADEDPAAPIVDKIVLAYGGHAALVQVKSVKHSGTIQSHRLGKTGSLQRLFVLPDKLRVDISYPGGPSEHRITTPKGAWRDGRPAKALMHKAMTLQVARFQLPLILTQHQVSVLVENEKTVELSLKLTESTSLEVVVDRQSWRIVRSVGRMDMGGMNIAFTADYSDFRQVEGVLFAHREELTAMGRPTGIAVLKRIDVNAPTQLYDFNHEKMIQATLF